MNDSTTKEHNPFTSCPNGKIDHELIAHLFRISQTKEKLKRDAVDNADAATAVHHFVGKEVHAAIERIGSIMPADLPTLEMEQEQLAALKKKGKQLMLDE